MTAQGGDQAGELLITNALLFDGWSAELTEADLRVAGGRIAETGRGLARGSGRRIDAAGRVVSPGLTDAHFHAYAVALHADRIETTPLSYVALAGQHRLRAALERGFTTVRDVAGGDPGLARAIRRGYLSSPRYLYTGAALSQTGGHGDWRSAEDPCCARPGGHMAEVVDGVDNLRRAVRERFRGGAHAIKIMTSGGVISYTDPIRLPQYSPEEVRAVTGEAARRGSYVAAHAYSPEAITHSVLNGVRSIEHGNLLDAGSARLMAEHGAFLVPTLAAYDAMDRRGAELGLAPVSQRKNREVLDAGKRAIELATEAGVPVGFGSDLMGDLADEQLAGVRLQGEVMGALGTLRAMTRTNALLLNDPGAADPLRSGAPADLVIWDGDPLRDLSVVWDERRPRAVLLAGRLVCDPGGIAGLTALAPRQRPRCRRPARPGAQAGGRAGVVRRPRGDRRPRGAQPGRHGGGSQRADRAARRFPVTGGWLPVGSDAWKPSSSGRAAASSRRSWSRS